MPGSGFRSGGGLPPVGPLAFPESAVGPAPKLSNAPTPLMMSGKIGSEGKAFKPVRPNRRLGARKTSRMAYTPPTKKTAFSDES